jgi:serine/threonine protein kinase
MLLRDYSFAVINLKKNEIDHPRQTYKGVYTHNSISSDEISEYFTATLVELNDDFKTCIVKKIIKERLNAPFLKKGISIEYLVTSYHRSNFIVRNMFFFEDFSYLYLYFDLQNYIHLNIFSFNPLYLQYFRDNLENNIKFIIAGVILGLEELHNLRIVYRGINNDNIVIRENGYPLLTNLACLHPEGQPLSIVYSTPFTSPE